MLESQFNIYFVSKISNLKKSVGLEFGTRCTLNALWHMWLSKLASLVWKKNPNISCNRKKLMRFFLAIYIPLTTNIFWWKCSWQLPRPFWEGDPCLLFSFLSFSVDQGINQNRTDNCIKARREDSYTIVDTFIYFI